MNKYNKAKFNEVRTADADKKQFAYFMESLSFKEKINMMIQVFFKTRRGCLLLSCLHKGMSISSAYGYAFKKDISSIANMLEIHGWDISFGKLS